MQLELDHVFILVDPKAQVADELLDLGMEESFSRDHIGQGTSNRRFVFENFMLEFLWVRDEQEANNGPAQNLNFPERYNNKSASPFGIIVNKTDNTQKEMPFDGWTYQPDYFKPPMAFHVGANSSNLLEPLCIYAPFIEAQTQREASGELNVVSQVSIYTTTNKLSVELKEVSKASRVSVECANEHLMEITFENNKCGLSNDFRPAIPLVIFW